MPFCAALCCVPVVQAATSDRAAKARLGNLDAELQKLKDEQQSIGEFQPLVWMLCIL
jgi:hypothetical protein